MICTHCRAAGDLLTRLGTAEGFDQEYQRVFSARISREAAAAEFPTIIAEMHSHCPGGTWCACLHRGVVITDRPYEPFPAVIEVRL